MKTFVTALAAAAMLCACSQKQEDPREHFQVYLCIGQSNMVGARHTAPPEAQDSVVNPRFLNLSAYDGPDRKLGEWRPGIAPICRADNGLCPADYFGRTMAEYLPETDTVAVINVAVDGSSILLFDKDSCEAYVNGGRPDWMMNEIKCYDGNPYARLISLAKQAQQRGEIRGVLIHQGCTDAYNDGWCLNVKKIYNDILTDLSLDSARVPLLVGEVISLDQKGQCYHANPTIDRISEFVSTGHTISARDCKRGSDFLHFSAEGYRRLGRRYGIKMLQLQGFNVPNDENDTLQIHCHDVIDAFMVRAGYMERGNSIMVRSDEPMTSINVVSYSGETLAKIPLKGEKFYMLKCDPYNNEDRLVLNITAENGQVVNTQVDKPIIK